MAAWHQHTLDWYLCLQDVLCLQSLELHRAYIHDAGLISHASMSQQICWCEQLSPLVLGCVIFLLSVVCLVLALSFLTFGSGNHCVTGSLCWDKGHGTLVGR